MEKDEGLLQETVEKINKINKKLKDSQEALAKLPKNFDMKMFYGSYQVSLKTTSPAYIAAYAIIEKELVAEIKQFEAELKEALNWYERPITDSCKPIKDSDDDF